MADGDETAPRKRKAAKAAKKKASRTPARKSSASSRGDSAAAKGTMRATKRGTERAAEPAAGGEPAAPPGGEAEPARRSEPTAAAASGAPACEPQGGAPREPEGAAAREPRSGAAREPEAAPARDPEAPPRPRASTSGLAELDEVKALLARMYPPRLRPESVAYYLSSEWHRNLEARYQAEQGQRFFESLVEALERQTGLDVAERLSLVDRPGFLLKILLHEGRRFPAPRLSDGFLKELGGEARILDVWISALGPYYYAKGYRLWPTLKDELEGPPPPLSRTDPLALRAMRVAAAQLKRYGYRRVPGAVARARVPGVRVPGQVVDENPAVFDLLFEGSPAAPTAIPDQDRPPRPRRPPPAEQYEVDEHSRDRDSLDREVDLEVEVFQKELEDELEAIQAEIDRARRTRR